MRVLALALSLFVLVEVNYPRLTPQSQLAIFALFGLVLCFLLFPLAKDKPTYALGDRILALASALVCIYVVVQTEPVFSRFWSGGASLGDRAGAETNLDYLVGVFGLLLVLEATRRCLGWALPVLSALFVLYAYGGAQLPGWLFPHRGYGLERIVAQTFLHSQGVFGIALSVMFTYVFLFVLLGAFLEATGATGFIVDFAQRVFRRSPGGAAKVAVLASGLMGSLSGSAVANAATTGTFTIPLMRSIGFKPHIAAGVTAAAASGGALVPPVMGAGAYMMLELVSPPVTFLEVIRAAILPAVIYYLALFFIVHFYAKRIGAETMASTTGRSEAYRYRGIVFFVTLGVLVGLILTGYTVFRSVSLSLAVVLVLGFLNPRSRLTRKAIETSLLRTARGGVPLVAASASVGIILGVVTLTGVGTRFPQQILNLSGESLLLALALIMVGSIVLGMGLPSAVCYLLMATLIAPIIGELGIVPLSAHFFIFYFGMMSMVTPPVALAAYTSASIAETHIMTTSFAAFRFSLVGFTLPFMFVFRPELLLLGDGDAPVSIVSALLATLVVLVGIVPLAAGVAGYLTSELSTTMRGVLLFSAALLFFPGRDLSVGGVELSVANLAGGAVLAAVYLLERRKS
ncbi:MAG TPA: TRAP transporter fused permease subunit [Vicinamibacteria bacterium]|nr:TRAP transporter fused permease subunit [Vicinamibacteria bacterium]